MRKYAVLVVLSMSFAVIAAAAVTPVSSNDVGTTAPAVRTVSNACLTINANLGYDTKDWPSTHGTQPDRLFRDATPSSCSAPKTCPGPYDSPADRVYDAYSFYNQAAAPICVDVDLTADCNVFLVAYSGSYDPASLCFNYLADSGSSSVEGFTRGFSVTVNPSQTLVLVAHEVNSEECGDTNYTITLNKICGGYDLSFTYDLRRSQICVSSITGDWQYTVLSGKYMGVYSGSGIVTGTGNPLQIISVPSGTGTKDLMFLNFSMTYWAPRYTASASLKGPGGFSSIMADRNTRDDVPGCGGPVDAAAAQK